MGLPVRAEPQFKLNIDRREMGSADTLRFNVLTYVAEGNYDRAVETLRDFFNQESEYPRFHERVDRYVSHSVDLVNAIRAKRNFPGAQYLTVAKQQELNEKFQAHFSELQFMLKKIERVQVDLKMNDVKSTVWVLKTLSYCVLVVFTVALALDVINGLGYTTRIVVEDGYDRIINWTFQKSGY